MGDVTLPTMLLGDAGEAADAFVDDADVVALHLFGEVATVNQLSGIIGESHRAVKDFVGSFADQSDFSRESLEVESARMAGAVINIALLNIGRQAAVKTEVIAIYM